MSAKSIIIMFAVVGSFIGSYVPVLFGVSAFSYTSVALGGVGGFVGIYVGYKITS